MTEMDGIKWVNDASHADHPLRQLYKNTTFKCDLCRTHGRGLRLSCAACDFNIHDGCAGLPEALPGDHFLHRAHPLQLRTSKPGFLSFRDCLLCGHSIRGASFECGDCDGGVNLHPLCARLPETIPSHALHPTHALTLEEIRASAPCDACGEKCRKWRYHCGACEVHIHMECLAKGVDVVKARHAAEEAAAGQIGSFLGQMIAASIQ